MVPLNPGTNVLGLLSPLTEELEYIVRKLCWCPFGIEDVLQLLLQGSSHRHCPKLSSPKELVLAS